MKTQSANQLKKRLAALMPNGVPRWIRCYDNGGDPDTGGSADRYTVVFSGAGAHKACGQHPYVGMSGAPFHPQGVCMHNGETHCAIDCQNASGRGYVWPPAIGRSCFLGKRIRFEDLPEDCRTVVVRDYLDLWNLRAGYYYGQKLEEK